MTCEAYLISLSLSPFQSLIVADVILSSQFNHCSNHLFPILSKFIVIINPAHIVRP
nr:MAG TPA: hypothetical protein [Caudoviricetes sp.]